MEGRKWRQHSERGRQHQRKLTDCKVTVLNINIDTIHVITDVILSETFNAMMSPELTQLHVFYVQMKDKTKEQFD